MPFNRSEASGVVTLAAQGKVTSSEIEAALKTDSGKPVRMQFVPGPDSFETFNYEHPNAEFECISDKRFAKCKTTDYGIKFWRKGAAVEHARFRRLDFSDCRIGVRLLHDNKRVHKDWVFEDCRFQHMRSGDGANNHDAHGVFANPSVNSGFIHCFFDDCGDNLDPRNKAVGFTGDDPDEDMRDHPFYVVNAGDTDDAQSTGIFMRDCFVSRSRDMGQGCHMDASRNFGLDNYIGLTPNRIKNVNKRGDSMLTHTTVIGAERAAIDVSGCRDITVIHALLLAKPNTQGSEPFAYWGNDDKPTGAVKISDVYVKDFHKPGDLITGNIKTYTGPMPNIPDKAAFIEEVRKGWLDLHYEDIREMAGLPRNHDGAGVPVPPQPDPIPVPQPQPDPVDPDPVTPDPVDPPTDGLLLVTDVRVKDGKLELYGVKVAGLTADAPQLIQSVPLPSGAVAGVTAEAVEKAVKAAVDASVTDERLRAVVDGVVVPILKKALQETLASLG